MLIEIHPQVYADYQAALSRKAARSGKPYVPKPYPIFFVGSIFYADPVVEVPDYVGRELMENRPGVVRAHVPTASETVVSTTEDEGEATAEDLVEMVAHLTCKYCKHVFKKERARMIHESRWCKQKPE